MIEDWDPGVWFQRRLTIYMERGIQPTGGERVAPKPISGARPAPTARRIQPYLNHTRINGAGAALISQHFTGDRVSPESSRMCSPVDNLSGISQQIDVHIILRLDNFAGIQRNTRVVSDLPGLVMGVA
jgi:hypothetical protein